MIVEFFKGVLVKDLKDGYIPGSVTTDIREALMWKERISGSKQKGAAKHVRHGASCIIKLTVDISLFKTCHEFQRSGINEHTRDNCWMNAVCSKAQINVPTPFIILTDDELNKYSLI